MVAVPEIWTRPEEALTIGTLKEGAEDHGLVAAVAVTEPETWTRPLETETTGRLNPGALDQGLVALVEVMVPEVTLTRPEVTVTGPVAWTWSPWLVVTLAYPPDEEGSAMIIFSRWSSVLPTPRLTITVSSFLPDPSVVSWMKESVIAF
jgi:hypothetical protein